MFYYFVFLFYIFLYFLLSYISYFFTLFLTFIFFTGLISNRYLVSDSTICYSFDVFVSFSRFVKQKNSLLGNKFLLLDSQHITMKPLQTKLNLYKIKFCALAGFCICYFFSHVQIMKYMQIYCI